ncbi:hypothetical protein ACA910_006576 [Epithemia clementina (nom. ined.)]
MTTITDHINNTTTNDDRFSQQQEQQQQQQPFLDALQKHQVSAEVMHVDHYRVKRGVAVRTDYIILVKPQEVKVEAATSIPPPAFEPFMMSKTYKAFRTLADELQHLMATSSSLKQQHKSNPNTTTTTTNNNTTTTTTPNNNDNKSVIKYCELVTQLVESQPKQVVVGAIGKVSFSHVKALAKQRTGIVNAVLAETCRQFPVQQDNTTTTTDNLVGSVAQVLRTFFLTDHCLLDEINKGGLLLSVSSSRGFSSDPNSSDDSSHHHPTPTNPILNPLAGLLGILDLAKGRDKTTAMDPTQSPLRAATTTTTTTTTTTPTTTTRTGVEPHNAANAAMTTTPVVVVPLTRRDRRSVVLREHDAQELQELGQNDEVRFELDDTSSHDDAVATTAATTTTTTVPPHGGLVAQWHLVWHHNNRSSPWFQMAVVGTALIGLRRAATVQIQLDSDWALLILFAAYCLGLHTPRTTSIAVSSSSSSSSLSFQPQHPKKIPIPPSVMTDVSGRRLLQRSMLTTYTTHHHHASQRGMGNSGGGVASPMASAAGGEGAGNGGMDPVPETTHNDNEDEPGSAAAAHQEQQQWQEELLAGKPMMEFPSGAELGSVTNCWGQSKHDDFKIRGPHYLHDKKKIPSQDFLFRLRGAELFLTDTCPEHVARNPGLLQGRLREVPTFLINFRLPWGVMILYFEIPAKFVPYLGACYEPPSATNEQEQLENKKKKLEAALTSMTPGERCLCRFLMNKNDYKNACLKIIPIVVKGPWVVRSVVGGKPALIGNKVPVNYVYGPADAATNKAMYWEADLDIAASSAARGILSVTRAYTQVLTLDLGFVVQGNREDELPEQMLVGARLHGVDPLTAPAYPTDPADTTTTTTTEEQGGFFGGGGASPPAIVSNTSVVSSDDDGSVTPESVIRE